MSFSSIQHIKKSKKPHACVCTGAVIPAGSPYVRFSGIWDGDFYSMCIHPVAAPIYERRNEESWRAGDEGLCAGDLIEDIIENHVVSEEIQLQDAEAICAIMPHKGLEVLIATIKESIKHKTV